VVRRAGMLVVLQPDQVHGDLPSALPIRNATRLHYDHCNLKL